MDQNDDQIPPRRKATRLDYADYSSPGYYYITICTHDKVCMFGRVVDGDMHLNELGEIANAVWHEIPVHYPMVKPDAWVVMPNHVHGIIRVGVAHARPEMQARPAIRARGKPASLGRIVGSYKSEVTKRIHRRGHLRGQPVWQRNYYDHLVRDEDDLAHARHYIKQNPARWLKDPDNPNRIRTPLARC